jgi:hypothetical protein
MSLSVLPPKANVAGWITLGVYLCVGGLLIFAWTEFQAFATQQARADTLQSQNQRLEATLQTERAAAQAAPSAAEIAALSDRVQWYNDHIPNGAAPVLGYLTTLEGSLPDTVRLLTLFYDRQGQYLALSIVSESEANLLRTLSALQDAFAPFDVQLERQLTLDGSGQRQLQYDVRVVE